MEKKLEFIAKVKSKLGLHLRPAVYIARLLEASKSKVTLTYKGESVNARSIMSIMILAAPKDAKVKVEVEGSDAEDTLVRLQHAFKIQFEEDF